MQTGGALRHLSRRSEARCARAMLEQVTGISLCSCRRRRKQKKPGAQPVPRGRTSKRTGLYTVLEDDQTHHMSCPLIQYPASQRLHAKALLGPFVSLPAGNPYERAEKARNPAMCPPNLNGRLSGCLAQWTPNRSVQIAAS